MPEPFVPPLTYRLAVTIMTHQLALRAVPHEGPRGYYQLVHERWRARLDASELETFRLYHQLRAQAECRGPCAVTRDGVERARATLARLLEQLPQGDDALRIELLAAALALELMRRDYRASGLPDCEVFLDGAGWGFVCWALAALGRTEGRERG